MYNKCIPQIKYFNGHDLNIHVILNQWTNFVSDGSPGEQYSYYVRISIKSIQSSQIVLNCQQPCAVITCIIKEIRLIQIK